MRKETLKAFGMRLIAGFMSMALFGGVLLSTSVPVQAAAPATGVISGGVTMDLENPPPLPEGAVPPQVGVGETLMGEKDGFVVETVILKAALTWAANQALDFSSNEILAAIFGEQQNKEMQEVIAKQGQIIDMLTQIINLVKSLDYKKAIDEKTHKVNTMWEKYLIKYNGTADKSLTAQQRKDMLKEYFNGSGENYVMQVLDLYVNYIEGKGMINGNIFSTYDMYALHNFWWEHEGYDFRSSLRMLDMTQFTRMWTLAYAVCEAHVQDKTPYAAEAKAAQLRLKQCLEPQRGTSNDLKGFLAITEKWPVKRLDVNYYTFQVPGRKQEFYIPTKEELDIAVDSDEDNWQKKYAGVHAYDALYDAFFRIRNEKDGMVLARDIVDYSAVLAPIEAYYQNNSNNKNIYQILQGLDPKYSYINLKERPFGFLEKRNFRSTRVAPLVNDYDYRAYTTAEFRRNNPDDCCFWLDARDDNGRIRKILNVRQAIINRYAAVFEARTYQSPPRTEAAIESEVTDSGAVTAVDSEGFTLTVDIAESSEPITERVFVNSNTRLADGSTLGSDRLRDMLNGRVQVSGTYDFQDETLTAKTITIMEDSGTYEVTGTVVSSVANVVIVREDETNATNGYFLPNIEEDIPSGTDILIRYHWENSVKTVDSFELLNGPIPVPIPMPEPEPDPDPDPDPDPVPVPVPAPNPAPEPIPLPVSEPDSIAQKGLVSK